METKACTKCGQILPASPEYFNHSSRNKSGYYSSCRKCRAKYRLENADKIKKQKAREYQCHKERYRAYHKESGRQNWRRYYYRNRRRLIKQVRDRQNKDYEAYLEHRRELYRTNPEPHRIRKREWAKNNPKKIEAQWQRRRARENNAIGEHNAKDIKAILKRQKHRCYWCQSDISNKYHIDHVIPLSKNGSDYPSNLVATCPFCNLSKKDKLPYTEWLPPNPILSG